MQDLKQAHQFQFEQCEASGGSPLPKDFVCLYNYINLNKQISFIDLCVFCARATRLTFTFTY